MTIVVIRAQLSGPQALHSETAFRIVALSHPDQPAAAARMPDRASADAASYQ